MKVFNLVQSINNALDLMLNEDSSVVIYGEDVGVTGGVFRVTDGLQKKYGEERVFDSPLAESALAGTAVGMAIAGLKPIIEMQFSGFSYPAFNQIITHMARYRNRTRGKYNMPVVVRMPYGGGINALEHHSESPEALFAHIPGLKVVIPSTPFDAKGLLISAIKSNDPVIFLEPKKVYRSIKQEVPEEIYELPIGKARVMQKGTDITLVTYGALIPEAAKAVNLAKEKGISVELIDLRSIYPIDKTTITNSAIKTGRVIVATESPRSFGVSAELISIVNEGAFSYLEAPIKRITGPDTIVPYPKGEHYYRITAERLLHTIIQTTHY